MVGVEEEEYSDWNTFQGTQEQEGRKGYVIGPGDTSSRTTLRYYDDVNDKDVTTEHKDIWEYSQCVVPFLIRRRESLSTTVQRVRLNSGGESHQNSHRKRCRKESIKPYFCKTEIIVVI